MPHCIAHIFEPLLRLLRPAPGRHRVPARPTRVPAASLLNGENTGLVRPYLLAHERREQQRQRTRRRTLWLAVRGIDTGPLLTHSMEVGAR